LSFGEEKSCHMADIDAKDAAHLMKEVYENYNTYAGEVEESRKKLITWDETATRLVDIAKGH
jgi:hypothetical protein